MYVQMTFSILNIVLPHSITFPLNRLFIVVSKRDREGKEKNKKERDRERDGRYGIREWIRCHLLKCLRLSPNTFLWCFVSGYGAQKIVKLHRQKRKFPFSFLAFSPISSARIKLTSVFFQAAFSTKVQ